jgi:hypothetical protein
MRSIDYATHQGRFFFFQDTISSIGTCATSRQAYMTALRLNIFSNFPTMSTTWCLDDDACAAVKPGGREEASEAETDVTNSITESELRESDLEDDSDTELIARAEVLYKEEKILAAARLLRTVKDSSLLSSFHTGILDLAVASENAISDVVGPPVVGSGWTKQGERHGKRPTNIYNKLDEHNRLTSRIETPIEASLLIPLLSVFNETDLYETWIPHSTMPRIGVQKSKKLAHSGKANQIIQLVIDVPWPLYTREAIINALVIDEIDDQGYIVVRLNSLDSGLSVPPLEPYTERVDFDGTILFRACPDDHELLVNHKYETMEPLVLVTFKV